MSWRSATTCGLGCRPKGRPSQASYRHREGSRDSEQPHTLAGSIRKRNLRGRRIPEGLHGLYCRAPWWPATPVCGRQRGGLPRLAGRHRSGRRDQRAPASRTGQFQTPLTDADRADGQLLLVPVLHVDRAVAATRRVGLRLTAACGPDRACRESMESCRESAAVGRGRDRLPGDA